MGHLLNEIEERLRAQLLNGLSGDAASYHAFLGTLSAHLRAFFKRRLTQAPDEVEDLVQETLLAVHNQRHTYQADQPVTAWLHAIAKYRMIDLFRRRARRESRNDALDDVHELVAASDGESVDARRDLAKLLATLPERQRRPIVCVKIEGRSVSETAVLTGMSESAVKIGVHRGLKALAARIRDES